MTNEEIGKELEKATAKHDFHQSQFAGAWSNFVIATANGDGIKAELARGEIHQQLDHILDALGSQNTLIRGVMR